MGHRTKNEPFCITSLKGRLSLCTIDCREKMMLVRLSWNGVWGGGGMMTFVVDCHER